MQFTTTNQNRSASFTLRHTLSSAPSPPSSDIATTNPPSSPCPSLTSPKSLFCTTNTSTASATAPRATTRTALALTIRHALTTIVSSIISNPNLVALSVFVVAFYTSAVSPSYAAPLSHDLPTEAAQSMEGLLHHLPTSVQNAISSSTGFTPAFLQSLVLILACEIGDRTFFVAAILAMKSSRVVVWSGAIAALGAMTILSAAIGKAFPLLLDKKWTSLAAAFLFLYFGVQLLREWYATRHDAPAPSDELAEVESELAEDGGAGLKKSPTSPTVSTTSNATNNATTATQRVASLSTSSSTSSNPTFGPGATKAAGHGNGGSGSSKGNAIMSPLGLLAVISPVFAKAFSMTLLAEWGDRSQIATIALAASRDMSGVIMGGVLGHMICTGIAVIGGRLLASSISERAVALMGGLLFVTFAMLTFFGILD